MKFLKSTLLCIALALSSAGCQKNAETTSAASPDQGRPGSGKKVSPETVSAFVGQAQEMQSSIIRAEADGAVAVDDTKRADLNMLAKGMYFRTGAVPVISAEMQTVPTPWVYQKGTIRAKDGHRPTQDFGTAEADDVLIAANLTKEACEAINVSLLLGTPNTGKQSNTEAVLPESKEAGGREGCVATTDGFSYIRVIEPK